MLFTMNDATSLHEEGRFFILIIDWLLYMYYRTIYLILSSISYLYSGEDLTSKKLSKIGKARERVIGVEGRISPAEHSS